MSEDYEPYSEVREDALASLEAARERRRLAEKQRQRKRLMSWLIFCLVCVVYVIVLYIVWPR